MSIVEKNGQIPDMFNLRHKHDSVSDDFAYDYSNNLFKNTLSSVIYNNDKVEKVLDKMNDLMVVVIDEVLPVRNIFFFTHSKYYNKHGK